MSEVYQLNDLETNILFDMIENEKSKFYGTKSIINLSSNFSARAEVIKPLSDYSGGVFIHMDSSTGFRVIIMTQANSHDGYMNFIDSTKF